MIDILVFLLLNSFKI